MLQVVRKALTSFHAFQTALRDFIPTKLPGTDKDSNPLDRYLGFDC